MKLGTSQYNPNFDWIALRIPLVAVCLFFFCSLSWGRCQYVDVYSSVWCAIYDINSVNSICGAKRCTEPVPTYQVPTNLIAYTCWNGDRAACGTPATGFGGSCGGWNGQNGGLYSYPKIYYCDTEEEAKQTGCEYDSSAPGCKPIEPKPEETCSEQKSACDQIPGAVYTPQHVDNGDGTWSCTGLCDVCNTQYWNDMKSKLARMCCDGGQAPPSFDNPNNYCSASIADDGQVWGTGCSNSSGNCKCQPQETGDMSRCLNQDYEFGDEPGVEPPQDTSSAPSDTLGDGQGDWEYDYYPILDTIRDTLVKRIAPGIEAIATCLTTGSCVGGGDTVIVNASGGFDTTLMTNTKRSIDSIHVYMGQGLDTLVDSLRKYQANTETFVGNAVDSLTDSIRKYMDDGTSKLKNAMDSINGKIDTLWNRAPGGADTATWSQHGDSWFTEGENISDTILGSNGYGNLDFGADSSMIDSLVLKGYTCVGDSCCLDGNTFCIHWTQDSVIVDSLSRHQTRLHDSLSKMNQDFVKDSIPTIIQSVYDSVKAINPFGIFDSTIMQDLGATIPNTNTCPEHCSKFEVKIPFFFGMVELPVDYGLCLGRSVFGGGNVLSVIRFIIRLIVAWTCISLVMWEVARHK